MCGRTLPTRTRLPPSPPSAREVLDPRGAFAHAPPVTQTVAQGIRTAGAIPGLATAAAGGGIGDAMAITVHVRASNPQREACPEPDPAMAETSGTTPPARAVVGGVALPRAPDAR